MADSDTNWRSSPASDSDTLQLPTSKYFQQIQVNQAKPSEVYRRFKKTLDRMKECFEDLNPVKGKVCGEGGPLHVDGSLDLHLHAMEFVRGGIVRILALWEGFVKDLLREYFTNEFLSCKDLKEVKAKWPRCETAIQNAIGSRARKGKAPLDGKESWLELLEAHMEECLENMKTPIFDIPSEVHNDKPKEESRKPSETHEAASRSGISEDTQQNDKPGEIQKSTPGELEDGIDATFMKLFLPESHKGSISQQIIDRRIKYVCRTGPKEDDLCKVKFKNVKQLWNVTRLYYGVRCMFACGNTKSTFENSLYNFPKHSPEDLVKPPSDGTENYAGINLLDLYARVCSLADRADVSYLTWDNMNRFFQTTAEKLCRALAAYCYDLDISAQQ